MPASVVVSRVVLLPFPPSVCTQVPVVLCGFARCGSAVVSHIVRFPFPPSVCTHVPVVPSGFARCGSLCASMFRLHPRVMLRFPSSSKPLFLWASFSRKDEGTGRLHSLSVSCTGPRPPDPWPRRRRRRQPPPPPHALPPPWPSVFHPLQRSWWGVALECSCWYCKFCGHWRGCSACKTKGRKLIVMYFFTLSISSVNDGARALAYFYKNITTFNPQTRIIFVIVVIILDPVVYFTTKVHAIL